MKRVFQASFNGFHIDSDRGISFRGELLPLRPKERAALIYLVQHAGKLIRKEELVAQVWNGAQTSDESIARCISVIRSQLQQANPGAKILIKNEYGHGYRFIGEVSDSVSYISEESFYALINASPDFIALKDGEGRWQIVNQTGIQLFNLEHQTWREKTDLELMDLSPPECHDSFLACIVSDEAAWRSGQPYQSIEIVPTADDGMHVFEVTKSPLFYDDGSRKALVILGRDVTQTLRAVEQNTLSAKVLANSHEGVLITNASNEIISINDAFTKTTGYTVEELIGKNPRILSSDRHGSDFYQTMWRQINVEGYWRGEIWDRRKNGEIFPTWMNVSTVRNQDGVLTNYIANFSDLTEHKITEEQLAFLAYHDPLTGLPNRIFLRDRSDQAIAVATREGTLVALLFLDLDQFKLVNDSLGHEVGDQLLLGVTERLRACVRDMDTISRLGGDEFVILLTGLQDVDTVTIVAQKILDHLAHPFNIDGHTLNTSFSIGISLYPDDGEDFTSLLKLADAAMYNAKESGRNTYRFFTQQMNHNALERLHLRNNLHQALERGEFVLHYQPQLELGSKRLTGVDALLRWNNPELGQVPLTKFIPVAEDSGLIVPIGEWVMHEACCQAMKWQAAGYAPILVAVNLSTIQFRRSNIVETVKSILEKTGLDPQWLELELTESILIHDADYALDTVRQLKNIGVKLSIDNFGIGYSSLAYLKRFPVDKLKVDQSFIRNLMVDAGDAAVVHTVIQLGHNLNFKTIAKGVETREQLEYLRNEGCDEVQGFYISHPLSAKDLGSLLGKQKVSVE